MQKLFIKVSCINQGIHVINVNTILRVNPYNSGDHKSSVVVTEDNSTQKLYSTETPNEIFEKLKDYEK